MDVSKLKSMKAMLEAGGMPHQKFRRDLEAARKRSKGKAKKKIDKAEGKRILAALGSATWAIVKALIDGKITEEEAERIAVEIHGVVQAFSDALKD